MDSNKKNIARVPQMSVLILDSGNWDTLKVLRCLGQVPTIKVYVLSNNRFPITRFSRYYKHWHYHRDVNDERLLETVKKLTQQWKIDVLLPTALEEIWFLSRNYEAASKIAAIPTLANTKLISLANDKWAFYQFLTQTGLPVVPTVYIGKTGRPMQAVDVDSIEYPALLKPVSGKGGFGIVKVANFLDLERAWHDEHIMKNSHYILQSYIPGTDVCLQVFCKAGKISVYTLQKSLSESNSYFGPQRIMEFLTNEEIHSLGENITSTLKWEGTACIDFRIDARDQKPKILEFNPRFGQAVLGSLVAGVNFPLIACCSAFNIEYPTKYKDTIYVHPIPSAKIFFSHIFGRNRPSIQLKWSESGLKFTCSDPLPEIVDLSHRIGRQLKHRLTRKYL